MLHLNRFEQGIENILEALGHKLSKQQPLSEHPTFEFQGDDPPRGYVRICQLEKGRIIYLATIANENYKCKDFQLAVEAGVTLQTLVYNNGRIAVTPTFVDFDKIKRKAESRAANNDPPIDPELERARNALEGRLDGAKTLTDWKRLVMAEEVHDRLFVDEYLAEHVMKYHGADFREDGENFLQELAVYLTRYREHFGL